MGVSIAGREVFNNSQINSGDINNPDIDGGTIDGATIATSNITVGAGKTLDVSAGTLTLANDQISGDKVEGGTINATTITTLTSTTANITTVDTNVTAAKVTLSGTTLAAGGTDSNVDINLTPKGTGEVNITKVDIDAGTIDGTVIGGSSAAAGKFTSLEAQTAKVTGGTPGAGKILTSDAVGNASWENAPSGTVPDSGTTANLPLVSDGAHGYSIASRDIRDIANLARVPNQGVAMTSATSGSNGITVADNDNIDFGTGNYTLVWKGSIPDWTPSSAVVLIQKTDGTNGWILQVATSGVLQLVRNAEAAKSSAAAPSITDGTTHEIVCVVTTETASVAGSVVFYVDGVQLGDTVTITAGSPTTVSNSTALYVVGTSSTRSASTTYHAYTFNRALTAAEVLDLYRNGISYADQWGSQTALTSGTLTTGKKYRINTYVSDDDFTNIGAASNASGVEFTATGTTPTHWAHSSSLVEIGATLALEPEGINETNWQDSSTNNLDATYPTTGWSLTRKVPTATTTEKGFAELATNAEALAGTDTSRIVTPDDLKYVLDRRIQQYYGVAWNESADTYVRTGSTAGQACGVTLADAFLSVHRRMRGCLVADDGTVNYYLCATDWTKKEDGATASDLTGTDGQVMVEIPKFWYRYGYSGTTHTYEVSPVPLTGFKVHEAFMSDDTEKDYLYVGAYEASLYDVSASKYVGQCHQTSVSAVFATSDDSITIASRTGWATNLVVGQKLVITGTANNNTTVTVKTIESATKITVDENLTDETAAAPVIQTQTDVTDTTGDKLASVSGVCPITGGSANGTRAHFRTWAENRGGGKAANDAASFQWSQEFGDALAALQLLYLTEYASFYSQSVLGYGIAAVADWAAYNNYNPIAKSGNGNAVGNASGNTATSAITTGAGAASVYLKYRGIENLYGHIWKFIDGYKVNNNIPYLCNNFANFSDAESTANYTNPTDVNGAAITMHNGNGYQGTLELCGRAFMPASLTGGDASAKITDYYYQAAGWRGVLSGGDANDAAYDGAFYLYSSHALADVHRSYGGRLVCRK